MDKERTGVFDKHGREICVGDVVNQRIPLPRHGIGHTGVVVRVDDGYRVRLQNALYALDVDSLENIIVTEK